MKKAFVAAASTALALALATGLSSAHQSKDETEVADFVAERFAGQPNAPTEISGRAVSKKADCRKARMVTAFHDVLPEGPGPEDFLLGTDITDKEGKFGINTPFVPDKVYVLVAEKVKKNKRHRHKCKPGASKTIPVGAYK